MDFTRQNPGLNDALPPSGLGKHEPSRLEEVVSLTHPFLGPLVRFRDVEMATTSAVATTIDSDLVPAGEVWYVPWASLSNPDAAQALELIVVNFTLGSQVSVRSSFEVGAGAAWPSLTQFPSARPLLLPPGFRLRGTRTAAGVLPLALTIARVRLKLAEVPPSL